MDTDDTRGDAAPNISASERRAAWGLAAFFSLPIVGWCGLGTYWFWNALPFWAAIFAGCLVGLALGALFAWVGSEGSSHLLELWIGSAGILIVAAVLTPVFREARENALRSRCQSNVKAASHALLMYARDNDDRFPPAAQWQAATTAYLPRARKQSSRTKITASCPRARQGTGYAFFAPLTAQPASTLFAPAFTPLMFDADVSSPGLAAGLKSLPQPERHRAGNVIGFADGHVRCQERTLTLAATLPARRLYTKSTTPGARSRKP